MNIKCLGNGWLPISVVPPEAPHRNIEVMSRDDIGQVFVSSVSSRVVNMLTKVLAWREMADKLDS